MRTLTTPASDSITNGHTEWVQLSEHGNRQVKKHELVRLMVQSLQDLGYSTSATTLEKESGFLLESSTVIQFRQGVLQGDWAKVDDLLPSLQLKDNAHTIELKFLLRRQKYLELLEDRDLKKAIHVLRNELAPLQFSTEQLHELSSLIMCSSAEELRKNAAWDGKEGASRQQLLVKLQRFVSPNVMVPEHRLNTLLYQAFDQQLNHCLYHNNEEEKFPLYSDHVCDKTQCFPTKTIQVLEKHSDEVWYVAFSNDGRYLASVSKDQTCVVWDMTTYAVTATLAGHTDGISYCAWSPDDRMLLTCSSDSIVKLWDPFSGGLIGSFKKHSDHVTSCAWLPDGEHFITGGLDKCLYLWNVDGNVVFTWPTQRVMDLAISKDGSRMVTITYDKNIDVYDLNNLKPFCCCEFSEDHSITSVSLSDDGRYALVNVSSEELHLWDLDTQTLVNKYRGQKQKDNVIRSTFGGHNQAFVVSGSEDNHVYVWNRKHGSLLQVLEGHNAMVNSVCWNPKNPNLFASASDDKTVHIWGIEHNTTVTNGLGSQ
ncbi:hypothetical protein K450DRAFT_217654 [Umbelopsis ramanniana AG]|uniref:CTLH domain-containing protein n=1 Tax=Umbelopsis ramanniana AG TaxID=1314678 RepID=A0AAD5HHN2_UMBRA|nr:uncharacterized protein K450DRAFT_217654 [Umbelopsis ramanniana AG]KAI8584715.1 hypothetical protein K450DRAFT_217654 [Umbelopsis ramanniana AG]